MHASVFSTVLGLLASIAKAALYETVIQTPNGPVQGHPAFNSSVAGLNLTNWQKVTVW
jgi:carboxylesterase 2